MQDVTPCANCGTPIVNPTTSVRHGDMTYCCSNCSEAMEQRGSGSDPSALAHEGALHCAHCDVPIVDETTMDSRGDQAFCCPNCAIAAMEASVPTHVERPGEKLPAKSRPRTLR